MRGRFTHLSPSVLLLHSQTGHSLGNHSTGTPHHHLHQNQTHVCLDQVMWQTSLWLDQWLFHWSGRSHMDIIYKQVSLASLWIMWPIIIVFLRGNFHLSDNIFQDLIWKLSNNLSSVIWEIARQSLGIKLCSKAHELPTVWSNQWKMIVHKLDISPNILIINKHVNNATKILVHFFPIKDVDKHQ